MTHRPPDLLISLRPDIGDIYEFWELVKGVNTNVFGHALALTREPDGLIDRKLVNLVHVVGIEIFGAERKPRYHPFTHPTAYLSQPHCHKMSSGEISLLVGL